MTSKTITSSFLKRVAIRKAKINMINGGVFDYVPDKIDLMSYTLEDAMNE